MIDSVVTSLHPWEKLNPIQPDWAFWRDWLFTESMYDLPLPANFINNFGNFLPDERKRIRFCYLWALYFTATWDALLCKLTSFYHWAFNLFHSHVWFWYIHGHWFITSGFIAKHHNDQSPVGLLTELIEHCTDIAEVMGSNPVRFTTAQVVFITSKIVFIFIF